MCKNLVIFLLKRQIQARTVQNSDSLVLGVGLGLCIVIITRENIVLFRSGKDEGMSKKARRLKKEIGLHSLNVK